jgi:ubiquinone/menaquinone biosynthesis C-methylase UbiE
MARTARGSYGLRHYSRAKLTPRLFSYIANNPAIARRLARLWGTNVDRLHAEYARLAHIPDGTTVLDVPCGSGVTFHHLPADRDVSYAAVDLSPVMIDNARAAAEQRELHQIEFYQTSVDDMPFAENSFDLVLTYNGLHCFPDPQIALKAMAHVLKPGGEMRGSCVVKSGPRSRIMVGINQRANTMGYVADVEQLRTWLSEVGLERVRMQPNGLLFFFSGRLRG